MNTTFETEMGRPVAMPKNLQVEALEQKSLAKLQEKKELENRNILALSDADRKVDQWLSAYRP